MIFKKSYEDIKKAIKEIIKEMKKIERMSVVLA